MVDRDRSDSNSSAEYSRRKLLGLTGGALTVGVAGCNDSPSATETETSATDTPDESTETSSETASAELVEGVFDVHFSESLSEDMNWNPWDGDYVQRLGHFSMEKIGKSYVTGEHENVLLEDWSFEGKTRTLNFRDDFTWWNGNQFTAEDYWVQKEIDRLQAPDSSEFDKHILVDDYTIKQVYKEQKNPTMVQPTGNANTPRWVYDEWRQQLMDATTQDERDSVTQDLLQNFEIPMEQFVDEGLGLGSYKITDVNSQRIDFEIHDGHPASEDLTIPKVRSHMCVEGNSCNQLIKADNIDADRRLLPSSLVDSVPDHLQNIGSYTSEIMYRLDFNQLNKDLQNRKVRQAIAYLLSPESIKEVQGYQVQAKQMQTGIRDVMHENWLDNEQQEYVDYGTTSNEQKAMEILENEGYNPPGGSSQYWTDPDGEKVSFYMPSVSWTLSMKAGNTVSSKLQEFGFEVDFQVRESGKWSEDVRETGTYDMTFEFHSGSHPIDYFHPGLSLGNPLQYGSTPIDDIKGWLDEGRNRSPHNGKVLQPEIPTDPGATSLDGGSETVNLVEAWEMANTAQSEEATKEYLKNFTKYWNYHVPGIDLTNLRTGTWGDTENWQWPEDEGAYKTYNALLHMLKWGDIQAKTQ